ncbi:class II aldolase/adducin family protein [Arhodomonas sp. SL1]|uniref:class II aldolase/adducin family protein n=1 Tax=Arhodomonas sp. SL1 TaxID=3425691 RepID=UPI003F883BF0
MEQEGVIKFELRHRHGPAPARGLVAGLDAWRQILHRLALLGQDPKRYGGLGFGNVSRRLPDGDGFLVSGTQTGGWSILGPDGYTRVTHWDAGQNAVRSLGPVRPSSESLTHGAVYAADAAVAWVFHVHSPEIWGRHSELGIAATPAEVPYGTPEMARAVTQVVAREGSSGLFAMGGHRDGIVAYAPGAETAGCALLGALAAALAAASSD